MLALSISQPWSWLIVNGHKHIENRDWTTRYRGPVLIHAGKKGDEYFFSGERFHSSALESLLALKMSRVPNFPTAGSGYERGGIVGIATLADVVTSSKNPWFVGRYGFVLRDARPLPFTPLRGQLGLFEVPDDVVQLLQEK